MALQDLFDKMKNTLNDDERESDNSKDLELIDEEEDVLPEDPKPSRLTNKPAKAAKVSVPTIKPSAAKKREIKDFLVLMITLPGGTISMRDPHCGGAFVDNAERIADALIPIICRNPAMYAWFTSGNATMEWFALAMAFQPVVSTIWKHHVTKSLDDHDHGEDEYDYTNFTAPTFG